MQAMVCGIELWSSVDCHTDVAVSGGLISSYGKFNYLPSTVEPLAVVSSCREVQKSECIGCPQMKKWLKWRDGHCRRFNMRLNVWTVRREKKEVGVVE